MEARASKASDTDSYIASFPEEVRKVLSEVRATIRSALPAAEEAISYGMPTFKQNGGYVVYFGGFRKHVSLYPAPIENPAFAEDLAPYASGRGTAKFSLDKPLPAELVRRIAIFNGEANARRAAGRAKKKP